MDVPAGRDIKLLHPADSSNAGVRSDPSARPTVSVKPDDVVGVYHTMEERMEIAQGLPCPGDSSHRLPDPLRKNLFLILTKGPVAVSRMRLQALREVNEMVERLPGEESTVRSSMHPDVQAVTKGKAILVCKTLLEETNFPDMSVVDLLVKGVPLVGEEQQLEAQCVLRRESLKAMRGTLDPSDLKDLLDETTSEVQAGFMTGPYHSESEVTAQLGTNLWSLSPRFLLRQGEDSKVRIIDDLKASAVNQAFASSSYLDLQDTDFTVGLLRFISRSVQGEGSVDIPMQDGTSLRGRLCPEMKHRPPLLDKTLDLSKAYRQVAIHPDSRKHAVLGFPGKEGSWQYYLACSLPFGASASVFGFNKIALAVLRILVVKFMALATDFYDDYTLFEFQPAASLLDKIAMRLLSILGWSFAKEGKKFVPFGSTVVSLGVTLDLTSVWDGQIRVSNKPGRLAKLAEMLKPIIAGEPVTRSQLASLHGLINFAGGYVLGFELKPTARMLSRALSGVFLGNTPALREACALANDILGMCKPRVCPAAVLPTPMGPLRKVSERGEL